MTMNSVSRIVVACSVLLTAACVSIQAESPSQEEASVAAKIETWPEKWKAGRDGLVLYASSIIGELKNLPDHSKRLVFFNRLIDVVLASSFEDCQPFPLEDWEHRPIVISEDDPRKKLHRMHRTIVGTVEAMYYEQRRLYRPMEERMSLILRFEQKMEKERKRLGAIDVGESSLLVDRFEKDLWYYLAKGEQTEEKIRLKSRFARTMGHPVRGPLQIEEEQLQLLRDHREAVKKNMEAYKRTLVGLGPD